VLHPRGPRPAGDRVSHQLFRALRRVQFHADLENQLDDISGGRIDWKEVLRNFWRDFSGAVEGTKDLKIGDVLKALDEERSPFELDVDLSGL
jgi:DNA topoisomerase I